MKRKRRENLLAAYSEQHDDRKLITPIMYVPTRGVIGPPISLSIVLEYNIMPLIAVNS